jgi:hypothetical protein
VSTDTLVNQAVNQNFIAQAPGHDQALELSGG